MEASWSLWGGAIALNTVLLGLVAIAPKKLLTRAGLVHAWLLGVLTWGCLGWPGYVVVGGYFLAGSAVTRVGLARKQAAGIAEKRDGARGPENVWGSAAASALCAVAIGLLSWQGGHTQPIALLTVGYVAGYSAKLSDTFASEIGKAYGKRTFSIISWQPAAAGTEGAVSLEGTAAGVVGGGLMAALGVAVGLVSPLGGLGCAIAALVATTLESVIGATLQERWQWLTNEWVNAIETGLGATTAIALAWVWGL